MSVESIVYVIDDDHSVREAVGSLLRSIGLDVRAFESTTDFLSADRPDLPSCLVLDVRLRGLSGLDFQSELIKSNIEFPIIFISGHGDIPMTVRAIKAGAIEFLTKPFRDQDLLDAVQLGIEKDRVRRRDGAATAELRERFELSDRARAGGNGAGGHGADEQADRRRHRFERDHREGSSRQRHAQDAGQIAGRAGPHGGPTGVNGAPELLADYT